MNSPAANGAVSNVSPETADITTERFPFYAFLLPFVKLFSAVFFKLRPSRTVFGVEHLPRSGGFILVSNHASYFDPPFLAVASPRQLTFLAKIELFRVPLFGFCILKLGAHPVDRSSSDRDAMRTVIDLLHEGHGVVIFPEGTRSRTGEIQRFKAGAAMLAVKARVPILPAYISGSFKAWPKGGRIRPHPVHIRFGPLLDVSAYPEDRAGFKALNAEMERAVRALGEESGEKGDKK